MKKKILILILIILVLFTASAVYASEDMPADEISSDEISVIDDNELAQQDDETANDDVLSADISTYSELSKEIGSGGDKNLKHAYYKYDGSSNTISITTPGTIDGKGAIIDMAGSKIRAFNVNASGVTIKNLTIKNSNDKRSAGAIYFNGDGIIINCNFTNNKVDEVYPYVTMGGAIYFGNNGTVTNCNFAGNIGEFGGAIYFANNGTVTNCNFVNQIESRRGGAILFNGHGDVVNCNFTNNYAGVGGAVSSDSATVTNCNFNYNHVNGDGGAIYLSSSISPSVVENCNFANNFADETGGALYMRFGSVENCNFTNSSGDFGGAIYSNLITAINCNFNYNNASEKGGAIYLGSSNSPCVIENCNFNYNNASLEGGALCFYWSGTVKNCNFTNNTAYSSGGAIRFGEKTDNCNVTNCNFINNTAYFVGGATWFGKRGNVTNCNFINNHVNMEGGAILSTEWALVIADSCIFKTASDTTHETLILSPTLNVDNFITVHNSSEKLTFDLKTYYDMPIDNGNISISVYYKNNNTLVGEYSCLSGEGWVVDLPVGSYYAVFNTDYARFRSINRAITVIPNIEYYANITPVATNSKTVNITAKSNIPNEIIQGKLVFILPNSEELSANYNDAGIWWATYKFNEYGKYIINAHYTGLNGVTINKATIEVKAKDVKKTTPKITAKNKKFKAKTKTKKYTITLKNSAGKPIKKTMLTLKVKGKTYKAKTNSKGKATFKIKKLTKKGKHKATVKFAGNKYYNKVSKKVRITLK